MNKYLLIAIAGLAVVTTGYYASSVSADSEENWRGNGSQEFSERFAQRFGLNQDEVGTYMNEMREEHRAERQAENDQRFDQLVSEGKLTEEQKNLIIAKHEEQRAEHGNMRETMSSLSFEEREEARESHREEMESWAEANGIDTEYLMLGEGRGQGMGMRGNGKGAL